MFLSGEKANGPSPDAVTRVGLASRLPGHARTVSTLMRLLRTLPRSATYAMSIPSDDHVSALLNTAFWASLQREEGRPVAVALLLQPPSSDEDLVFEHAMPLSVSHVRGNRRKRTECRYDFIYVTPDIRVHHVDYMFDEAIRAVSDHALVIADLELQPKD